MLAGLIAVGEPIPSSADGRRLRDAFDALERRLMALYGTSVRHEIQLSGAAHPGEEAWMRALAAGERRLISRWSGADGAQLPPALAAIELRASSRQPSAGWLRLKIVYRQPNGAHPPEIINAAPTPAAGDPGPHRP